MKLAAHLTAFPFGALAGEACIELDTDVPVSYEDAKQRFAQLYGAMGGLRGVGCLWLADVPWGVSGLDAGLLAMTEDMGQIRRVVPFADVRPTALDLTQLVDVTALLGVDPVEPGQLRQTLALRLQVPRADELVVQNCRPENLTHAHLDAVSDHFVPAGSMPVGFLMVPADLMAAGLRAIAKASSPWRIAPLVERVRIPLLEVR